MVINSHAYSFFKVHKPIIPKLGHTTLPRWHDINIEHISALQHRIDEKHKNDGNILQVWNYNYS